MPESLDKNEEKYVVYSKITDQVAENQVKWLTVPVTQNTLIIVYLGHFTARNNYTYLEL